MKFHLTLLALLGCASAALAQSDTLAVVTSSTDGQGLFSYTFTRGVPDYVFGIAPGRGSIQIQSHGILSVSSPVGWVSSVDGNELVSWHPQSGTVFIENTPLTFFIQSSITTSTLYDSPFGVGSHPRGILVGDVYSLPEHFPFATGFETFTHLGPQAVPEPASFALLALTGVAPFLARRRRQPAVSPSPSSPP